MASTANASSTSSLEFGLSLLVNLFEWQLSHGCGREDCETPICYTYQKYHAGRPPRRPTAVSARATAFYLASLPNVKSNLCRYVVESALELGPNDLFESLKTSDHVESASEARNAPNGSVSTKSSARPKNRKDPFSFPQRLFDTKAVERFMSLATDDPKPKLQSTATNGSPIKKDEDNHQAMVKAEQALAKALSLYKKNGDPNPVAQTIAFCIFALADSLASHFADRKAWKDLTALAREVSEAAQDAVGLRLATNLTIVLGDIINEGRVPLNKPPENPANALFQLVFTPLECPEKIVRDVALLKIWIQDVFMHHWNGSSIIKTTTVAAAALRVLEVLRNITFDASADGGNCILTRSRHDLMTFALEWRKHREATFSQHDIAIRREPLNAIVDNVPPHQDLISLVDYPWAFLPSSQVNIFRALCFCRMAEAIDTARLNTKVLAVSFSALAYEHRPPPQVSSLQFGPLQIAMSRFLGLKIDRNSLLSDAFDMLWRRQRRELFLPLRVQMRNAGEVGVDQGGLAQEFFRLAFMEAFDPVYGLFTIDDRTRMAWFDPKSLEPSYKYELLGLIMAMAIYNGFTLPVTFPLALYRRLLGYPVETIHDIADGWPELAKGLTALRDWHEGDVEDVFLRTYTFTFEAFGSMVHVDMTKTKPVNHWSLIRAMAKSDKTQEEAPLVTNKNRHRFVRDYILWLTEISVSKQFDAFVKGFQTIFDERFLSTLTPATLQSITEGEREIDTHALEASTGYEAGYCPHKSYVKDFWKLVHSYGQERRRQLLEFVTASDRVPVSGIISVDFVLQRHGGDTESLPTSVTCFGRLLLPEYSSKEKLETKLGLALDNARGFGLS